MGETFNAVRYFLLGLEFFFFFFLFSFLSFSPFPFRIQKKKILKKINTKKLIRKKKAILSHPCIPPNTYDTFRLPLPCLVRCCTTPSAPSWHVTLMWEKEKKKKKKKEKVLGHSSLCLLMGKDCPSFYFVVSFLLPYHINLPRSCLYSLPPYIFLFLKIPIWHKHTINVKRVDLLFFPFFSLPAAIHLLSKE